LEEEFKSLLSTLVLPVQIAMELLELAVVPTATTIRSTQATAIQKKLLFNNLTKE
jgi:hypothetical protein